MRLQASVKELFFFFVLVINPEDQEK
jgi:hypothetical protein